MNNNFKTIQTDIHQRNEFIIRYKNFILSSASKATGRHITEDDDEYSVALEAFNDAITKFEDNKGDFFSFAALIIKRRIIDNYRKNKTYTIPFSSLSRTNSEGETEEFDVAEKNDVMSDASLELGALKVQLENLGISLFDLPGSSPKSAKTKKSVYNVLQFIINNPAATKSVLNGEIPVKLLCPETGVKPKLLERHRKYIIAATVILLGDYPVISGYINNLKGVKK